MTPKAWALFDKLPLELRNFFNQFEYGDEEALTYALSCCRCGLPYKEITNNIQRAYKALEKLSAS